MNGDNLKMGTDARKDAALAHHDGTAAGASKVAPPVNVHLSWKSGLLSLNSNFCCNASASAFASYIAQQSGFTAIS